MKVQRSSLLKRMVSVVCDKQGPMAEQGSRHPEEGTGSASKALARNREEGNPALELHAKLSQILLHLLRVLIT